MDQFQVLVLLPYLVLLFGAVHGDPEANVLQEGCSTVKATNTTRFKQNLNSVLSKIRANLTSNDGFSTASQVTSTDSVYGLAQCRPDKSSSDCLKCFDVAAKQIKNCSSVSGGRAIYDGCFLRYESNQFYEESTGPGNSQSCGSAQFNEDSATFSETTKGLLADLVTATPKTRNFFAAQQRSLPSNMSVYALAYCIRSVSESGCSQCLQVGQNNIVNCLQKTEGRGVDIGCYMRYSTSRFFSEDFITDLSPYLSSGTRNTARTWIIVGVSVGVALVALICLFCAFWFDLWPFSSLQSNNRDAGRSLLTTNMRGPVEFELRILKKATDGFSQANKLGEGGFGDVYKGVLKNGTEIAVKKLKIEQAPRAMAEFESEIRLIANVRHRNLLRLLGCCHKGLLRLLVYEFMPNSSLDRILFGEGRKTLSWETRFSIILGTARGLAYLHDDFDVRIIHRDIKASNILLDEDFCPKIADFGVARLLPQDQSHVTTRIAGTLGYTAPEYALNGQLTDKADVFSYGIVVLEIISGRKSIDTRQPAERQYLLEWAWKLYEGSNLADLVDEAMDRDFQVDEVLRVIHIALLCTQAVPAQRPSMMEVVAMLVSRTENPKDSMKKMDLRPGTAHFQVFSESLSVGTFSSTFTPR